MPYQYDRGKPNAVVDVNERIISFDTGANLE